MSSTFARSGARILGSRRLMRAPIHLYRARLGFLFGSRMLMLEHIGRKSGAPRQVVLEVFGHPDPSRYFVVSGFGGRSQWFRNVQANPAVRVTVGSHQPAPATARVLSTVEADAALQEYVTQHPKAWAKFKPVVEATLGTTITDHETALPVVELRLG
ncbi:MAG TPA: nitroreductase family deazaflavin-dependent oxidoreductase [Mycobacteriales bacterium]|nr:nitroreductase family deazaflavin-dependent oxidoreductase [Mycobacteriales bacterium]